LANIKIDTTDQQYNVQQFLKSYKVYIHIVRS